jgi:hypothetical protein
VPSGHIPFGENLFEQPLLGTSQSGQIYALTQFGELLELTGGEAVQVSTFDSITELINDLAITPQGNLAVATRNQGILIFTPEGEFVDQPGSIVPNFPLPGEMVAPVGITVDPEGNLYFADSDGTFGAITAMSTAIAPNRLGSTNLVVGLGVQGILNEQTAQQQWLYMGTAGERVTITAIDPSGTGTLDLALHLLDPNGAAVAFNDDHESPDMINFTDAQIQDYTLPVSGQYIVVAERVEGEGTYSLGLSLTRTLTFDSSGIARTTGELSAVFPTEILEFSGSVGQTLTLTMEAASGDLDPVLRLIGPNGDLMAENDDADDRALGTSAQLTGINLPADGTYRLEAARFDGAGRYNLMVVRTS